MDFASLYRNLGTYLSCVRSLDLDEMTVRINLVYVSYFNVLRIVLIDFYLRSQLVQILYTIGNKLMNSICETNIKNRVKPQPNVSW